MIAPADRHACACGAGCFTWGPESPDQCRVRLESFGPLRRRALRPPLCPLCLALKVVCRLRAETRRAWSRIWCTRSFNHFSCSPPLPMAFRSKWMASSCRRASPLLCYATTMSCGELRCVQSAWCTTHRPRCAASSLFRNPRPLRLPLSAPTRRAGSANALRPALPLDKVIARCPHSSAS